MTTPGKVLSARVQFRPPCPVTNIPSEHMTSPAFPGRILVVDDKWDVLQAAGCC